MKRDEAISRLQQHEADMRRLGVEGLYLFGSTARGEARHPNIPWQKVAGIGNVLRHNYESIAAAVMWKLARDDLEALEEVCRAEFDAIKTHDGFVAKGSSP